MPPKPIVDLREIDLDRLQFGPEEIRRQNPHRHEFELLTGVIAHLPEEELIVGEYRSTHDAFWARGHIPGRPLMPGVLMVETAAQLCSFYWRTTYPDADKFFGFGGIENTRFRGTVAPGDRLIVVGKNIQLKPRRAIFDAQGFVDHTMVFETRIIGLAV
ncbi:MAG: 3-hydroxyacyl-ACP dehydratase FabZ family protein [Planctomycetota bacterium]|jgi:3-hydroxyacyl-[acyl-carrier-protein] dehydratase